MPTLMECFEELHHHREAKAGTILVVPCEGGYSVLGFALRGEFRMSPCSPDTCPEYEETTDAVSQERTVHHPR